MKTTAVQLETFVCDTQHARLTRAACAASYRRVNRAVRAGADAANRFAGNPGCERCPIGKAHAAGEPGPPAVEPIVRIVDTQRPWVLRACMGCGEPLRPYAFGARAGYRKSYCSAACASDNGRGDYMMQFIDD